MKRWKNVHDGVILQIITSDEQPQVPGNWSEAADTDGPGDEVAGDGSVSKPRRFVITVEAFWARFTLNERADILIAEQIDLSAGQPAKRAAAKRQLLHKDIDAMVAVKLKSTKVAGYVNDLEAAGILSAGRADGILTTPGADGELP